MQVSEGQDRRDAWGKKGSPPCLHPIYDRERIGSIDSGRFLCIVCGEYVTETLDRQPFTRIQFLDGLSLLEWNDPGGQRYQMKLEEDKWWYRRRPQEAWRPGLPPKFVSESVLRQKPQSRRPIR